MTQTAKAEDVSEYFYKLCLNLQSKGNSTLTIILDNNRTHKDKMRYHLWHLLKSNKDTINFKVNYMDIAPYSPDYNLAEYAIHLLRLNILHYCHANLSLNQKEQMIQDYFQNNHLFTETGVKNIINRIIELC